MTNTRQLIGRSNQLLATLLAHLAEVEARGIHRERACSSLYTYCVYELRLSEDAAFRRARAAKLARQFPVIFQPPELDVPDRIEPLGPGPVGIALPSAPKWNQFVESYARESSALPDTAESKKHAHGPRQRVAAPAPVRREVRDRDGKRCAFVDDSGQRCRETRFLELHHKHAHALGGNESAANLTLWCEAHNSLAAERDFGRTFILRQQRVAQRRSSQVGRNRSPLGSRADA